MKTFTVASLALVLALSGCASSPSVEEQTKLIEYQVCLESYERLTNWSLELEQMNTMAGTTYGGTNQRGREELASIIATYSYEESLKECEKYRP
jgi:hypothetical protein